MATCSIFKSWPFFRGDLYRGDEKLAALNCLEGQSAPFRRIWALFPAFALKERARSNEPDCQLDVVAE